MVLIASRFTCTDSTLLLLDILFLQSSDHLAKNILIWLKCTQDEKIAPKYYIFGPLKNWGVLADSQEYGMNMCCRLIPSFWLNHSTAFCQHHRMTNIRNWGKYHSEVKVPTKNNMHNRGSISPENTSKCSLLAMNIQIIIATEIKVSVKVQTDVQTGPSLYINYVYHSQLTCNLVVSSQTRHTSATQK